MTLGPLSLYAWGTIRSDGYFDINLSGGIDLTWQGNGVKGSVDLSVKFDAGNGGKGFRASVGGSVSALFLGVELFGVSATGIVEGQLGESVTLYLQIKGTGVFFEWVTKVVEMLESAARAAGYAIKKFFEGVGCEIASWFGSKCKDRKVEVEVTQQENVTQPKGFTIPIATFNLPSSLSSPKPPPANLATRIGDKLWLNVGEARAANRGMFQTSVGEIYEIAHVGGIAGSESIRVTAFGRSETFDGIASIEGDFGSGVDSLNVLEGVYANLVAYGGSGNDSLAYNGYGTARLEGGEGHDSLYVSNAVGSVILRGNGGDDLLVNDSNAPGTLEGGAGADDLRGGSGDDVLDGGDGDDVLQGRGGKDTVRGGAGNDLIRETLVDLVAGETFDGGANVADDLNDATFDPFDAMEIIGSAGPDSIRVSVVGGQLIISELLGNTVVGSFTGIGVERLRLTGEGAADTFLLVGALEQGGLKTLSIDTGAGADLVTTQLTAGDDDVTVVSSGSTTSVGWTGHYALTIGNTTTNDRLRIEALGGNDILNAAGVVAPVPVEPHRPGRRRRRRPDHRHAGRRLHRLRPRQRPRLRHGRQGHVHRRGRHRRDHRELRRRLRPLRQPARDRHAVNGNFIDATAEDISVFERATLTGSLAGEANTFLIGSATRHGRASTASTTPACSPGAAARTSPAATAATRTASRRPACAAAP